MRVYCILRACWLIASLEKAENQVFFCLILASPFGKTYFVRIIFEVILGNISVEQNLYFLLLGKTDTVDKTCIMCISAEAHMFYQRACDNKPVLEVFLMPH